MTSERADVVAGNRAGGPWTCFHCGDTFTTPGSARDHFGFDMDCEPGCRIKAGAERGLLMALRKAEMELADLRHAIAEEGTEAARAYYSQMTRHNAQLMAAEEAGYEKGLADGRALTRGEHKETNDGE